MAKRYFAILQGRGRTRRQIIAAADSDAIGRVLADLLREHVIGAAEYIVTEMSRDEFEAYKRSAGSMPV